MIRILLLDDDAQKAHRVRELLDKILAQGQYTVDQTSNTYDAGLLLRQEAYDLLILDINLPMRRDAAPQAEGGVNLLRAINARRDFRRPSHIVGLTSYPDLASRYSGEFGQDLWYLIEYSPESSAWEDLLARRLIHLAESKSPLTSGDYNVDLAILTALQHRELEAVLELPGNWTPKILDGDSTIYHEGVFQRDRKHLRVVAATADEMGMPTATAISMKLIQNFTPKVIAIVGIAAGVQGNYGDILVADQSWDYGSGKTIDLEGRPTEFRPAPVPIPLEPTLKAKLSFFAMKHDVRERIRAEWKGTPYETHLGVQIGPVASGAAVLESPHTVRSIAQHNRKLIGVEMETYGVFVAARYCRTPRPVALSAKSICDFADERKSDDHQAYAAFTSARFLYEFAMEWL